MYESSSFFDATKYKSKLTNTIVLYFHLISNLKLICLLNKQIESRIFYTLLFHSRYINPIRLLFICCLSTSCRSLSALLLLAPILIIILLIPTIPVSITITLLIIIALIIRALSIALPVTPWLWSPIILLTPTFLRLATWPIALLTPYGLLWSLVISYKKINPRA